MKFIKVLCIPLLLAAICSCIRDNNDDCENTFLCLSYFGDGATEIFPEKIGKVNLYVYNEEGWIVKTTTVQNSSNATFNLPAGTYDVVCWGNAYENTDIRFWENINTAVVSTPGYMNFTDVPGNDSLYYGRTTFTVHRERNNYDTVRFSSAHIKMHVKLTGFSDLFSRAGEEVDIETRNLTPSVSFTNTYSPQLIRYNSLPQPETYGSDVLVVRYNVLRFEDDNEVEIDITEPVSGLVIHTLELQEYMVKNDVKVSGIHEAVVPIHFRLNGTTIEVLPWENENISPGW